jgi:hypothetical protein
VKDSREVSREDRVDLLLTTELAWNIHTTVNPQFNFDWKLFARYLCWRKKCNTSPLLEGHIIDNVRMGNGPLSFVISLSIAPERHSRDFEMSPWTDCTHIEMTKEKVASQSLATTDYV